MKDDKYSKIKITHGEKDSAVIAKSFAMYEQLKIFAAEEKFICFHSKYFQLYISYL